jgi:deoxycytidylate deaminase
VLTKENIPYKLVSPFCDEDEARTYADTAIQEIVSKWKNRVKLDPKKEYTATQLLEHANFIAKGSFDYSFQTGVTLGKPAGDKNSYNLLIAAHNTVVPFETYALHNGASRETNFSPPNDLNHYDAVHAEVELIVRCVKYGISLKDTALFINLLPCPTCARMLCETDIAEIVYQNDHSDGYAVKLLEKAGKTVRRMVI